MDPETIVLRGIPKKVAIESLYEGNKIYNYAVIFEYEDESIIINDELKIYMADNWKSSIFEYPVIRARWIELAINGKYSFDHRLFSYHGNNYMICFRYAHIRNSVCIEDITHDQYEYYKSLTMLYTFLLIWKEKFSALPVELIYKIIKSIS